MVACVVAALAAACAERAREVRRAAAAGPNACSWYGDADERVLYFGESGFWSALHAAGGDATGDLATSAPQVVGRFDLAREAMLPPLSTALPAARSGTWDVLVHPNGRVYFTSFYDPAGSIDRATGAAARFDAAGLGLNELALLPDGRVLATRYGGANGGDGSIVVLTEDGAIAAEYAVTPTPGFAVAPKSIAFDAVRSAIWINTDLIPTKEGATRFDARIHDLATGRELARFEHPELHFFQFAKDGRGYFAWLEGRRLVLRVTEPGAASGPDAGRAILLDDAFPAGIDFVQDLRVQRDGRVVATRWSGAVHVLDTELALRTVKLPRRNGAGLFYTAVATGDRVCATRCDGVDVVCMGL